MVIYGSYSDFTTKGHGVIEGFGWQRKRKGKVRTPIYSRAASIPKSYNLLNVVDNLDSIRTHLVKLNAIQKKQLVRDLELGYISKVRSNRNNESPFYAYIKPVQFGKFEIYSSGLKPSPRATIRTMQPKKQGHKQQVESTYQHLLSIQKNAKRNRG